MNNSRTDPRHTFIWRNFFLK